jgi:hypothetical protein
MSVFHSVSGKFSRRGQIGEGIVDQIGFIQRASREILGSPILFRPPQSPRTGRADVLLPERELAWRLARKRVPKLFSHLSPLTKSFAHNRLLIIPDDNRAQ